ncbi:MAG: family 10 glycosylhydrolase [Lentisphaeria bacterium]|nr:family 10 glycosylhydrolase [Lentisphaeria bacterium]
MISIQTTAIQSASKTGRQCVLLALLLAVVALALPARAQVTAAYDRPPPGINMARAATNSITSGSARAATLRSYGAVNGLELNAHFTQGGPVRASWDFPINANLANLAAVQLKLYCPRPALARQFNVYIKAGETWYSAAFAPAGKGTWEEIVIPKTRFMPEGAAESWQHCSLLRLAAWQGSSGQLAIHLADLHFLPANVNAALLRSSSKDLKESYRYARHLGESLFQVGILPAVLEEPDCAGTAIRPFAMSILAYPPAASPTQNSALIYALKRGSKLCVFHTLSPILATEMELPAGKFTTTSAAGLTLGGVIPAAALLPEARAFRQQSTAFLAVQQLPPQLQVAAWWADSTGRTTSWPAIIECPKGFWMTHVYLNQDPAPGAMTIAAMLARHTPETFQNAAKFLYYQTRQLYLDAAPSSQQASQRLLNDAAGAYKKGQFSTAIVLTRQCQDALANASTVSDAGAAVARTPRRDEIRAVWSRRPDGLPGRDWDDTAAILAKGRFNAVFPNVASAYSTAYPSALVSQSSRGDALAEAISACRRHRLAIHAWVSCLGVEDASDNTLQAWRRQGRLQQNNAGITRNWLCPTQVANRALLINIVTELAGRYPLDGVQFDLIRYPETNSCFCPSCRKSFEAYLRRPVSSWPAAVMGSGGDRQAWQTFRQDVINSLVADLAKAVRDARPGIAVSAAVYPDQASAKTMVGQNWHLWLNKGWVDVICPMNYRANTALFAGDLDRQTHLLGNGDKIIAGIGVSSERLEISELQRQIATARAANARGYILFELTPREAYDLIPKLSP